LTLSEQQAEQLQVNPYTQISGYLEKCCLLVSANNSYERTAEDVAVLTGMSVSRSTQQRLVHRHRFECEVVDGSVDTVSIDGGKVRLRTPLGQESLWNDYKAVTLRGLSIQAYFRQNEDLVTWVNAQPLAPSVSCLGDGHEGIWNLFAHIGDPHQRREILDWFHLMENLHKVAPPVNCGYVKACLFHGKLNEAIWALLRVASKSALKFIAYLQNHRSRLPHYQALQQAGFTIGSGEVESAVKQINRRLKISGAQWSTPNVSQVLKHRCAYLNGYFAPSQSLLKRSFLTQSVHSLQR
jgi:hypothetical protein